jgi:glyoxylase I family protein
MGLIDTTGIHHLRLTVTDLERSRAFYTDVLGFEVVAESQGSAEDPAVLRDPGRLYGGVVFRAHRMLLGLRPVAPGNDRFVAERVGLDHLSFAVADREVLTDAAEKLEKRGVPHGEVRDLPDFGIAILSFSDPDGVHLELTAPL